VFKILDYVDKLQIVRETPTHLTCVCPVCGDVNFKIKKTGKAKGAYKCWSNECLPSEVKDRLGFKSIYHSKPKRPPLRIIPQEIPFRGTTLALTDSVNYPTIYPKIKKFSGGSVAEERLYPYSSTQRVLRIDNITTQTKYVYIQYQDEDFTWVSGSGSSRWPVYTHGIDMTNTEYDTVVFVEGEKTAEFCKERGLAAFTLMSSCFHGEELDKTLMFFFLRNPHIQNIIFIPDEDEPGFTKARNFQVSCWRHSVSCKILKMSQIVSETFEGMDLADLTENQFQNFVSELCHLKLSLKI
jgi:putative DNA primase/helicase